MPKKQEPEVDKTSVRWPRTWTPLIAKAQGKRTLSEFVRDCIAKEIGVRKMPKARRRGRPRKEAE